MATPTEKLISSTLELGLNGIRRKITSLPLPSGVAIENGTAVQPDALTKIFDISGITTATVHVDGSIDAVNWFTLGNVTANGQIHNSQPWPYVRARISAWTTGTIVVKMAE